MAPELIKDIASRSTTKHFRFGSEELEAWTNQHRNRHSGICHSESDWYVVLHPSLDPARRSSFKVLSRWIYGKVTPISFDIPE